MLGWLIQIIVAMWLIVAGSVSPLAPSHVTFVALGDSLTYGYNNPGPSWPVLVSDNGQGYYTLVNNAGVVGDTTTHMLARMPQDVFAYSPGVVIILAGVNDLGECIPVADAIANIESMTTLARAHGVEPVLLLNPHDGSHRATATWPCGGLVNAGIATLGASLVAYGASQNILTIDLRPVITGPQFFVDGIHWNAAGTALVAQAVTAALER